MWESFDMKKQGLRTVGRTACVLVEGLGISHVALSEDVLGHSRQSSRSTLPQLGLLKTGLWVFWVLPGLKGTVSCLQTQGCWWAVPLSFHEYQLSSYCCFNVPASH